MKSAIAIMGGTFDPLHMGHIHCAKHAAAQLALSEIVLLPAHIPPHKKSTGTSPNHRLAMLNSFVKSDPLFRVDERELNSSSTSYTVNSLKIIKAENPDRGIFFIIGMDSLLTFTQWHLWEEILTYCNLIVNTRPGYHNDESSFDSRLNINNETQALLKKYQTNDKKLLYSINTGKIFINPPVTFDISSSLLRKNIQFSKEENNTQHRRKAALFCKKWLPEPVYRYIQQHQLYSSS